MSRAIPPETSDGNIRIGILYLPGVTKHALPSNQEHVSFIECSELSPKGFFKQFSKEVENSDLDWVCVVSGNVTFTKQVGKEFARFIHGHPSSEMVYSDSSVKGFRKDRLLRTDYCHERHRSQNFIGPVVFYSRQMLTKVLQKNSFNDDFFDYALSLESAICAHDVGHIPKILYVQDEPAMLSENETHVVQGIVQSHLTKHGGGVVEGVNNSGIVKSKRAVKGNPLISIVIPTRGVFDFPEKSSQSYVLNAVSSIVNETTYENFEIVIVLDSNPEKEIIDSLKKLLGPKFKSVVWNHPFNFSQKMNYGVLHTRGEYLLLLNDDVEVINGTWLENMLAMAQLPNAGMVGAMLYYEDDTIQHAGHAYYQGSPTHIGLGLPRGSKGPNSSFLVERKVSGVTAACAVMPRHVFMEAGGFSALLPGNFNDVDLCLKVGSLGYDIYWTPNAELYHYESKTRDAHVHYYELDVIEHRWGLKLDDSRYWRGHPAAAE